MWTTPGKVSVASSDAEGLKKALQMISDLTAVPEIGKTYLGKVVRLAEFGAFVEIFPGTDGLLHISEIAEHRVKEVKDELREGDQVMVKVLAIEGNRIKLSRKALIKEQKAKLAQSAPAETDEAGPARPAPVLRPVAPSATGPPAHEFDERQPSSNQSTILIEGGDDFDGDGAWSSTRRTSPTSTASMVRPFLAASTWWQEDGRPVRVAQPSSPSSRRRTSVRAEAGVSENVVNQEDPDDESGLFVFASNVSLPNPASCRVRNPERFDWSGPVRSEAAGRGRIAAPCRAFAGVHAQVGGNAQGFGIAAIVGKDRDAHAGANTHRISFDENGWVEKLRQVRPTRESHRRDSWALPGPPKTHRLRCGPPCRCAGPCRGKDGRHA
jgi:predicted RNA-binding protein with RPS1 domain